MISFPLIFDGAYGTFYAQLTGRPSTQVDQASIDEPEQVIAMHEAYLQAGARALKTNTFGLPQLGPANHQLAQALIQPAVACARAASEKQVQKGKNKPLIFADLGPVLPQAEPLTVYQPLVETFLQAGVDGFLFETLPDIEGMAKIAGFIKEKCPNAFVMVSLAVGTDGLTRSGLSGRNLLKELDQIEAVDAMGYNCLCGPAHMHRQLQDLPAFSKPLSFMPNAGYPSVTNRRTVYEGTPEYFASQMAGMVLEGASIVGGCCGTSPDHIARLVQSLEPELAESANKTSLKTLLTLDENENEPDKAVSARRPDLLDRRRMAGQKAILVELDPPESDHVSGFLEDASRIHQAGADLLTIADNPIGRPRADSSILACKVHRELGMDVLPHLTCRDRNLNAIKALLLGLSMEDVHQVLLVTGDPLPMESRDEVRSVFSFNSRTLAAFVRTLCQQGVCRPFHTLGALDVNARNFEVQLRLAKEKEANGIEGFLTQPVFSPRALENLRQARAELGGAIYGGIMPIVSYRNACFLKNEITGMDIPDELAESFQNKTRAECEEISKAFCFEKMEEMKDLVDGFYLMTPFRRIGLICDLIQQARRLESQ